MPLYSHETQVTRHGHQIYLASMHTCKNPFAGRRLTRTLFLTVSRIYCDDHLFCLLANPHYRGPRAQRPGIGGVESCATQTNRFVASYPAIGDRTNGSLGRDFDPNVVLTAQDQVDKLILQATSLENLCQCFSGWYDPCASFNLLY
jgi:hypothetical protein